MPLNLTVGDLRGFAVQADHELRAGGEGPDRRVELREGSWGGRAVRNLKITFGEDRSAKQAGNLEVKDAVLKALSDAYGPEVAKRAFVAGAGHLNEQGKVASSSNHPLTGRHIEKMLQAAEREAARGLVQELKHALGTPNDQGGVSWPKREDGKHWDSGALGQLLQAHVEAGAERRGITPEAAARELSRQLIPLIVGDPETPHGLAVAVARELKRIAGDLAPAREVPVSRIQVAEAEDRFRTLLHNPDNLDAPDSDDPAGRVVYALKQSFGDVDVDGRLQGWHTGQDGTRPAWESSGGLLIALQTYGHELRQQDPELFAQFHRELIVRLARDPELPQALTVRLAGALLAVSHQGQQTDHARALAERLRCRPDEVLRTVAGEAAGDLTPEEERVALRDFAAIMGATPDEIRKTYGIDVAFVVSKDDEISRRMNIAGEMRSLAEREPPVDRATAAMLLQRLLAEAGLPPTLLPPDVDLRNLTGSALARFPPAFDPER